MKLSNMPSERHSQSRSQNDDRPARNIIVIRRHFKQSKQIASRRTPVTQKDNGLDRQTWLTSGRHAVRIVRSDHTESMFGVERGIPSKFLPNTASDKKAAGHGSSPKSSA